MNVLIGNTEHEVTRGIITILFEKPLIKGVITLGNTTKKAVVKHRLIGNYTACGTFVSRYTTTAIKTNKTWKGVTCKRCLAVKAKAARTKTTRKTSKTTIIGASA